LILLFSFVCPNGHRVGGEPHDYPGTEYPPDAWMSNVSTEFLRRIRRNIKEWPECPECHTSTRARGWGVIVDEMKAETMEQAHAALAVVSVPELQR
jgi:hypothetical protein